MTKSSRLNPDTCPKLIAHVKQAWDKDASQGVTIYKGFAYHIDGGGEVWTCFNGAVPTEAFNAYRDRTSNAYEMRNAREKKEERRVADGKIYAEHSQRMQDRRNYGGL